METPTEASSESGARPSLGHLGIRPSHPAGVLGAQASVEAHEVLLSCAPSPEMPGMQEAARSAFSLWGLSPARF